MYYTALYNVYSLKMMQYLIREGFDVVKVKLVPEENLAIFSFELTEDLIEAVNKYNAAVKIINNRKGTN